MFIFEVAGIPVPQKQTRFNRSSGHAYNPSSLDAERVKWQIRPLAPQTPLPGAVELHLHFFLPIPASASKAKRRQMLNGIIPHTKKPDFDNLAYLITNALKGLVYVDDAQVTDCMIRKRYSDYPRTVIRVIPILELEKVGVDRCD